MEMRIRTRQLVVKGSFGDPDYDWHRFLLAVNELDVTVLATVTHRFPLGGVSGCVVIGESHAAIHTWPEENSAWLELATCGSTPDALTRFSEAVAHHLGEISRTTDVE